MYAEATTVKPEARNILTKHRCRVRFYDTIALTDDNHPVDLVVQRWLQHGPQQRRILNMQEKLLARLAPDARCLFIELEELRNKCSAEREEAYFDAGVAHGIERERWRLPNTTAGSCLVTGWRPDRLRSFVSYCVGSIAGASVL